MRPDRRSRTAEATAAMRAVHQWLDDVPRVLDDSYAYQLLSPTPFAARFPGMRRLALRALERRSRFMLAATGGRVPIGARRMRAQVLTRSRFAEDLLLARLEEGVDQFVLLGAGLDTFALRNTDLSDALTVFEVDHPQTQRFKRERIERLTQGFPPHLQMVACDFETQTLDEALAKSAYDPTRPAVFSWLGVTYYLSLEAIRSTLDFFAHQASGGQLVFDYWTEQDLPASDRALLEFVKTSVAAQGEPMQSFFDPDQLAQEASAPSLEVLEDLSAEEINDRYLKARRDGLLVPDFSRLAVLGRSKEDPLTG